MGNEYLLKLVVDGLENLAADHVIVCEYLNLRAALYRYRKKFTPTPFVPPHTEYPDKRESQKAAADRMATIAENATLAVLFLGGTPVSPAPFEAADEAEVLRLVLDWEILQSGAYKAIVQFYGQQPARSPALASPGASSEERLWAEVVAWLTKIAADTSRVVHVQHLETARLLAEEHADDVDALRRFEQGVHKATLNTLIFAGLLPHHLWGAAHADRRKTMGE